MTDRAELARLCRAHGIDDAFTGIDGVYREVPTGTLEVLADALDIRAAAPTSISTIEDALRESDPPRAFVPEPLIDARAWGFSCQLGSLRSDRNAGIGDFGDLIELVRVAAAMGADFIGLNPLHALFSADPGRASPFSPSNRAMLNPIYIALDRVPGFDALPAGRRAVPGALRSGDLIDLAGVHAYKRDVLADLFAAFPWTEGTRSAFARFKREGGDG